MAAEAFILAGGVSSRMGRDKCLLELGGVPVLLHTIELLAPLVPKITVVGAKSIALPDGIPAVSDDDYGLPCEPGKSKSPLFGIATALSHSQSDWNLVLACDLPFLTSDWLSLLLACAEKSTAQIVMPLVGRQPQPLAAMYRRECGPAIVRSLRTGVRKVKEAVANFPMEAFAESEWHNLDPHGILLKGMNTPADYKEACRWWRVLQPASANATAKWRK